MTKLVPAALLLVLLAGCFPQYGNNNDYGYGRPGGGESAAHEANEGGWGY